jgi:tetratricopeptide (TPR) repeat protein
LDGAQLDTDLNGQVSVAPSALTERPGIPRILVLPPREPTSGIDPFDSDLARSLVTDMTLTLCKSRLYEVIAPFTAGKVAGSPGRLAAVAADYHVRTGLISSSGPLPCSLLSIEVVATRTGESVFSNEVELRSGTLLDLHYGLSSMLAERICGRIGREEILQFRRTGAASAYVHYLLAMKRGDRTDLSSLLRAQKSLLRSVQLSPDYVPALSQLARTKTLEWLERSTPDRTLLGEARHLAERGQLYEPTDSASLREIGHAALYLHDLDTALANFEAAQTSAPSHADLLADQADVLTHLSRHIDAEAKISRAFALNPLAPDDYYWIGGAVSFFRGRYDEALDRLTTMQSPGSAFRLMAACAAMYGDGDAAAFYRERALARDPTFAVDKWTSLYPQPNQTDTKHYLDALRLAGFSRTSS